MSSTRITLVRRICADPASTALLLAGPTALELWPGVRRVAAVDGRVLVEAELDNPPRGGAVAASVTAGSPRRTPTSFVSHFAWTGPEVPVTTGVLTLTYVLGEGSPSTCVELVLDAVGIEVSRVDDRELTGMAEAFLANLARTVEARRAA